MRSVAVVGASLAGWRAAQELREQGFDGRLTLIGAEHRPPYDRPPLSKEFLSGHLDPAELALGDPEEEDDLDAEWRLGRTAVRLDPRTGTVTLDGGDQVRADGVVAATGASRSTITGAPTVPGSHLVYTLDDALALRESVGAGSRVVVVGGGLTGSEVASTCRSLGARVTLVEGQHVPLVHTLGIEIASLCLALHEDHGVRLRCGTRAARVLGTERVTGVELTDGRVVPADVVAVCVGAHPTTEWLRGSGVRTRQGVLTDAGCVTRLRNVVAVGDVAQYQSGNHAHTTRTGYWSHAMNQPTTAVRNLLAGSTIARCTAVPHFWSRQYGCSVQFAGEAMPKDKIEVVDGSTKARKFVATYRRGGRLVAVFAMNDPKRFAAYRRKLTANSVPGSGRTARTAPTAPG
ncbi:3-phenylpropionate/trans-cinnamate dioxygenase ferredoxin reductase subunit [Saccharopolyspora lacisalsi]|uniref:3-phenylpropionate/trans-cinnamate dioxygenase ferredoxin reductase subunit n=1 Tax=Halosaccharopolyspora lacisalsi TaxID=1000566 RepID=A0A839E073_9PSEU|nr:FAD-dependent oxidoreductase [Halosaccharopolyspora lacisalsi]MBA8825916.1 3-phenylpropionate/trans-cinnamate dioxygenase ferredoxin reductase subunit [Halosaccharopolyspora lacisalsi]